MLDLLDPLEEAEEVRIRKRILEVLVGLYARGLKPDPVGLMDPRIRKLAEILEAMERLEPDPKMRARWRTLRRVLLWLITRDGAYKIRAIVLASLISQSRNSWKLRPWECRYFEE